MAWIASKAIWPFDAPMEARRTETLASDEPSLVPEGEVIYADHRTVLCRRWCWRQGNASKITAESRRVLLNVHALPPATRSEAERACQVLIKRIRDQCGGSAYWYVLDSTSPSREIELGEV